MQMMQFGQLAGISECTFLAMDSREPLQRVQLLRLHNLAFTDETTPPLMTGSGRRLAGSGARLLQGPQHRGWRRLGLVSLPEAVPPTLFRAGDRPLEMVSSQQARMLFFDWRAKKYKAAWVALLKTQDQLRPQNMSLMPQFVVPLIFLTHMQDRVASGQARRWLAHFDYSYRHSFDLIVALFGHWVLAQRTPAAQRQYALYAAGGADLSGPESVMTPAQQQAAATFERHFKAQFETLRAARRWEAALLRALTETSRTLWTAPDPHTFPDDRTLTALLPLALWPPEPAGPVEAVLRAGPERLGQLWREGRSEQ